MSHQTERKDSSLLQELTTVDLDVHLNSGLTVDDLTPYVSTPMENHMRYPSEVPFRQTGGIAL